MLRLFLRDGTETVPYSVVTKPVLSLRYSIIILVSGCTVESHPTIYISFLLSLLFTFLFTFLFRVEFNRAVVLVVLVVSVVFYYVLKHMQKTLTHSISRYNISHRI